MRRCLCVVFVVVACALRPPRRRVVRRSAARCAAPSAGEAAAEFPVALDISRAFFRGESRLARDLAVLGADYALRGRSGRAAVVDAFAGSGARSLRYAADVAGGNVDVLANEPNDAFGALGSVGSGAGWK